LSCEIQSQVLILVLRTEPWLDNYECFEGNYAFRRRLLICFNMLIRVQDTIVIIPFKIVIKNVKHVTNNKTKVGQNQLVARGAPVEKNSS